MTSGAQLPQRELTQPVMAAQTEDAKRFKPRGYNNRNPTLSVGIDTGGLSQSKLGSRVRSYPAIP